MPLTTIQINNTKPADKTKRFFYGQGLYLEISRRGGRWWQLKYPMPEKTNACPVASIPECRLKKREINEIQPAGYSPKT